MICDIFCCYVLPNGYVHVFRRKLLRAIYQIAGLLKLTGDHIDLYYTKVLAGAPVSQNCREFAYITRHERLEVVPRYWQDVHVVPSDLFPFFD